MKTIIAADTFVEDLNNLYSRLKDESFDIVNVARDKRGTYVHLADEEEKDPLPIVFQCSVMPSQKLGRKEFSKRKKADKAKKAEAIEPKKGFLSAIWKKIFPEKASFLEETPKAVVEESHGEMAAFEDDEVDPFQDQREEFQREDHKFNPS